MMLSRESKGWPVDAIYADKHAGATEELPHGDEDVPENTATTGDEPRDGYKAPVTSKELSPITNTPMPLSAVGCSTERTTRKIVRDYTASPSRPTKRKGNIYLGRKEEKNFVKFEETIIRRSDRIKTAKRVEKLGGIEYF